MVPAGASLPSSALSARAHGPCRPHASAQGPTGQRAGLPSCLRGCHCRVSGLSWLTVPLAGPPGRTPGNSHCGPRQPSQNCTSQKRRVGHLSQSWHPTKASLPLKSDPPHTDGTRGHSDVDKNSRLLGPCLSPAHQPADSCPGTAQSRVPGHGGTSTAHSRTSELQPQPISSSHGTTGLLLCSCVLEGNRWHTDRALRRD